MVYVKDDSYYKLFATIAFILVIVVCISFGGCSDPEGTKRVLRQQNYTDIEITGFRYFTASKGDMYVTGFKAKAPNGETVTGVVTSGWFKGHTVRLD